MDHSSPESHDLARQLLALELRGSSLEGPTPTETAEAGQRICQKLYQQIAQLIGSAGFSAVGARSLHLARVEFSFLDGVVIETQEGVCLKGLREKVLGQPPEQVSLGIEAIYANFIWLLITFIGRDLALRQLRNVWPQVSPGGPGAGAKERNT